MDLVKILDLNKFQLREDKFSKGEEDECEKSVSWRALAGEKNKGKYIKLLGKINTNPKYQVFHQLYFHAGDEYQYQKYGYLKDLLIQSNVYIIMRKLNKISNYITISRYIHRLETLKCANYMDNMQFYYYCFVLNRYPYIYLHYYEM